MQTRYNLPLEIFYTIAPIMMVVVFFYCTVNVQNEVLDLEPEPDARVEVVGQQWSWTFNYTEQGDGRPSTPYTVRHRPRRSRRWCCPVDQTVQFNLHSPDVIHSFGVPAFLMKMDVVPGRVNKFQVTPTAIGDFAGKCSELCGTYHSRMLFNVEVVSQADYDAYLARPRRPGLRSPTSRCSVAPTRVTQAGLDDETPKGARSDRHRDPGHRRPRPGTAQDRWASSWSGS